MSEGPPIVQYWHEAAPPQYMQELLASFSDRNPGMPHLLFSEATADRFIAERFSTRELQAFRACAVPAMQADYLRYCAVYALGGIYADVDYRCEGSLSPLVKRGGGRLFQITPDSGAFGGPVVNGFFAFGSRRHRFLELALEVATANIEHRVSESVLEMTGPAIFTALVALRRLGSMKAFLELIHKGRLEVGKDGSKLWDPELFCAVVGSDERLVRSFDGVRIEPFARTGALISDRGVRTPYKLTGDHYKNFKSRIYR